ncbi:hypothetical protein Ddye_016991 [Dipteronia dyeriana]|uniref:RNase H type-1 domain-containing protein n=1 Tax=Dipteronia dyeriana TaxID=168575 RepID=A0AAD9X0S6_9ROSI|nr:hypothetical protein Ddye_016991 [Dipteronia dyeriana]
MAASAQLIQTSYNPQVVEVVALLCGIILIANARLSPVVVDSNAMGVVNLVNAERSCSANIGLVIDDIRDRIQGTTGSPVLLVSRKTKCVAQSLSKMPSGINDERFWLEYPLCVERVSSRCQLGCLFDNCSRDCPTCQ